jgi:ribosome-associated protein
VKSTGTSVKKTAAKATTKKAVTAKKPTVAGKPAAKKSPAKTPAAKSAPKSKTKSVAKKSAAKGPIAAKAGAKPKAVAPRRAAVAAAAVDTRRLDLLKMVEKSLDADKGEDIVHIDLADKSAIADFLVIATGRNARQLAAMAQHVAEKLGKAGIRTINIEGLSQGDWVLVDGGDIIVHLFRPEIRTLYGLEKMWGVNPPTPDTLQAVG